MKFLLLLMMATSGLTCDYKLLTPELNVWGYPVAVDKILNDKLDSQKFRSVEIDADFEIKASHYQKQGRFLKYAYAKFEISKNYLVIKEVIAKKMCFMINCSVSDFVKVLLKNTKNLNKQINCSETTQTL